ncbi:hypothetical protein [Lacipirellula parvula]|uniref:Uncharacterized protein n=1 Tax=Lacipirellula parvula TaxID=2650471 RepID=A0A5K7XAG6_9BACT|nr:hypothetical protein [Lacipirellula parvula]BBO31286.1 hypothetical protein PLANPX_0898 [Lacipirellula parvula]
MSCARRWLLLALIATFAAPSSRSAVAQLAPSPAANAAPATAIEYRRVFVPADRTADWPTGGAQFLPIERKEFERLVEQAEQRRQLDRVGGAQLESAEYTARLAEGDALTGSAKLAVKLVETKTPAVLSLAPWNAVLLRARWQNSAAESSPATIGLWTAAAGSPAKYGLLVERTGAVEIDWQLAVERQANELEYLLELPNAVTQRLTLELPPGAAPSIATGQLIAGPVAAPGGNQRWVFQLAGGGEHRIRISRPMAAGVAEALDATASLPLAAMTEAYHLTPDGADYEGELRLQPRGTPLTELRLQTPPSLHIAEISVDRQIVEWRRDPDEAGVITALLPARPSGVGDAAVVVTIRGAAAANFESAWKLPNIVAEQVFWTEGTTTLWIDPALELRAITPRECSLLNVVGVGSGAAGEVYRLQSWSSAAAAEIVVGDRREVGHARSATVAEFSDREIVARSRTVFWAEGGRTFHVIAPLVADWNIELVEGAPADAIVEWHVEEGEHRQLHLQLRRSPTAAEPLTVAISARKPWRAWTRMATLGDLEFVRFPSAGDQRWLLVKDRRGNQIIPDAELADAVAAAAALPVDAQPLLGDAVSGLLLDLNDADPASLVTVASTAARFAAEARLDLTAAAAGYEQRAEFLCRPLAGSLVELRLLAQRPLPADAEWDLESGEVLSVEPIANATAPPPNTAATADGAKAPVQYRLRLPQARTAPFRFHVTWRSAAASDAVVNQLTLPDAENWQAWAIFRGRAEAVDVDSRGAAAAPVLPPAAAGQLPALACLRLGDDPAMLIADAPGFTTRLLTTQAFPPAAAAAANQLQPTEKPASETENKPAQTGVIAWSCHAQTQQLADGTQSHRIVYAVESPQPTDVQLTAPAGASFVSVAVDGHALVAAPAVVSHRVRFQLPGVAARQALVVQLERKIAPLERHAQIEPALPEASFPVVRGTWNLRWPAAYNAVAQDGSVASAKRAGLAAASVSANDWLARLFGPVSGRGGERWYDGMLLAHVDAASPVIPATSTRLAAPGGWTTLTQSFVDHPAPVALRLASGEQANWHVAWLIAAVASAWLWARSRRGVVTLAAAAAAICLTVPLPLVPLPQAVFLGVLTGAVVRQSVSFLTRQRRETDRSLAAHAAVLLSLTLGWQALVEENAAAAQETAPPQVFFPVDDQGQPVGDDVYVPAPMAASLLPTTAGVAESATLVDANYQVELEPSAGVNQIVATRVVLRFRWKSERTNAVVELPLHAADGLWDAAQFLLDGQPITPSWNVAGTSIAFTLAKSGDHELTARMTPVAASSSAAQVSRLQLSVPPLAGGTLEVLHPAGLMAVHATAATHVASESSAARTLLRLAPAETLDLVWPARLANDGAAIAVEQLSLLEVDPAAARLDVRLRLSGDGAVDAIRLLASPQLKLLPLPEGSPLEISPSSLSEANQPGLVELRFRSAATLPQTVALQFQLQRTLSVGRIDYPWVDVLGMNVRLRHFAVIADPRLRVRDNAGAGLAPVSPAELEPLWGPAVSASSLQYAASVANPQWSLDVTPTPPRFSSRESLELHCDDHDVRVVYTAAIAELGGELLAHRLSVAPELQIEQVSVTLEGVGGDIPVRWARPRPDQVQLFLSRPLTESHVIRVAGRLHDMIVATPPAAATADAGTLPAIERRVQVPRIGLEASPTAPIDLLLFRASDLLVGWADAAPPAKATPVPVDSNQGLLVGQYALARGAAALPELVISPNNAEFDADALLMLELDPAETVAECRLRGEASRGLVDTIELIVDKNWRGPFAADQGARVTVRDLPADPDRQLLEVRLAAPVAAGGSFGVRVRGPVSLETDQRIRFPSFRIANAKQQQAFLVLPPTAGNLTAEWTLRGLQPQRLPKELTTALGVEKSPQAYRVLRERFIAEQRVFPDAMRVAAYRQAENRLEIDAAGHVAAQSQLIVQAGGGDVCRVTLPAGAELEYASVDGVPQAAPTVADGVWQAPAGSRFLPRVFLLSYRLPRASMKSSRHFSVPQVAVDGRTFAPQRSLWQVVDARSVESTAKAKPLGAAEFAAAARRGQIDAFLDAYPLASQLAEWELQLWRQPWFDRLDATAASDDPEAWTRLRERFGRSSSSKKPPADVADARELPSHESLLARHFQGDDEGALELVPQREPLPYFRWFGAFALVAAIGFVWRHPVATHTIALPVRRWPYAAVAAAGALWWWYLTPALPGLAITAVAVIAYWKSRKTL